MSVIDDYLKNVSSPHKEALQHISNIIKQTVPDASEVITYGMPGFKYNGKYLISFAVFKDHMSIFPGAAVIEDIKDQLTNFKTSKGTIQFTIEQPIPDKLIIKILKIRIEQIDNPRPK